MRRFHHVAIAGAGIVGLACSLALRRRGFAVTVLEAGAAMGEASWAAGGMLAVEDPENPPALLPLSRYSRSLYDGFLAEVASLSGHNVGYRTHQTLQVVESAAADVRGALLSAAEARCLVPGLAAEGHNDGDNFLLLEEQSLDPRDLCSALPLAARQAGVTVREHEPVTRIACDADGVILVTAKTEVRADAFVNCCGAWSETLDAAAGIAPRKGQMLVVQQSSGPRLAQVLRSAEIYLIPRADGRIAIGATVEDAGFSKQVETEALLGLRRRAAALWPAAMDATLVESWAGLRPGSADGLPTIAQTAERRFLAAGHFRNGILLAPGTAEAIADLVCSVSPAVDLQPFRAHRGALSPVCDKQFAAAL
ncbi:MAG: FAD-dependent oxidoreductase [Acidobacteriaceae bacterium]|nr:FAD-dependent oxidoreductase [Acidobacteriaceae bacterium]